MSIMTLQGKPSTSSSFFRNTITSSGNTLDIIYQSIESIQNDNDNNNNNNLDFDGLLTQQ